MGPQSSSIIELKKNNGPKQIVVFYLDKEIHSCFEWTT